MQCLLHCPDKGQRDLQGYYNGETSWSADNDALYPYAGTQRIIPCPAPTRLREAGSLSSRHIHAMRHQSFTP